MSIGHHELDKRLKRIEDDINTLEDINVIQYIKDFGKVIQEMTIKDSDFVFDHTERSFYIPVPNAGETSSTNSIVYISGGSGYVRTQWNSGQTIVILQANDTLAFRQFKVRQRVFNEQHEYVTYEYTVTQRVNEELIKPAIMSFGSEEYSSIIIDEGE